MSVTGTARIMLDDDPPRLIVTDEHGAVLIDQAEPHLTPDRADAALTKAKWPRFPGADWTPEWELEGDDDRLTLVGYSTKAVCIAPERTTA